MVGKAANRNTEIPTWLFHGQESGKTQYGKHQIASRKAVARNKEITTNKLFLDQEP